MFCHLSFQQFVLMTTKLIWEDSQAVLDTWGLVVEDWRAGGFFTQGTPAVYGYTYKSTNWEHLFPFGSKHIAFFFCAEKTSSSDGTVDDGETIAWVKMDLAVTATASIPPPSCFIMRLLPIKMEQSYGKCSCALQDATAHPVTVNIHWH